LYCNFAQAILNRDLFRASGVYQNMSNELATPGNRCEINVTPLIDVLLVLLIIFMIITPLTPAGLPAMVPQMATPQAVAPEAPVILQMMENHSLRLNGRELAAGNLTSRINQLFAARADKVLFIQANPDLEYREVAQIVDLIRGVNPEIEVGLGS
jgi:biopolymer transport protein ExbD